MTPVSNNVWNFKGHPQLAVTRDTFILDEGEETRTVERTLLHVAWWEDTLEGTRVLYRPLILEGGRLQGMGEVYVLNDLVDLSSEEVSGVEPSRSLLESPVLQAGRDNSSLVMGFADEKSGRLVLAEIRLLPMGLGKLGEEVAEFVAGYSPGDVQPGPQEEPGDLRSLAGVVRGKILIGGNRHRLNPRAVQQIADEVHEGLLTGSIAAPSMTAPGKPSEDELRSLAGVVRGKILIGGARIAGETLDRFNQAVAPGVLEMATDTENTGSARSAPHLVRTLLLSSVQAPELPSETQPYLFVSPDGAETILAWAEPSALAYRKSVAGGWGEVRRMSLGEELPLADALEIVRRSVQPGH